MGKDTIKCEISNAGYLDRISTLVPSWLASSTDHLVVVIDKKGCILYTNETFKKATGNCPSHNDQLVSLVKHPDKKSSKEFVNYCIKKKSRPTVLALGRDHQNQNDLVWTKWDFNPVNQDSNLLIGLGRVVKEFDLLTGELFNANISHAICDSVILSIADSDGKILMVNDNFCDFTKYNRKEIIGKRHRAFIYDYHSKSFWREMIDTVEKGKSWNNDVKIQSKEGRIYWFHTLISPILDEEGDIVQLLHIQFDITEHKTNEEEKMNLFKKYDRITANLPGFVFQYHLRLDDGDNFPFISYGIMDLLGLSPADLEHSAEMFFDKVYKDDTLLVSESIKHSAKNMSHWNISFRMINSKNEVIWVQTIATPSAMNDGGIIWHGFCFDITKRKKSEEKLLQQQKTLSEIAFIQAHEFRRPIANMLGVFDMIQIYQDNGDMDNDQLNELLDLLQYSVKETDAIIAKIVTKTAEDESNSVRVSISAE